MAGAFVTFAGDERVPLWLSTRNYEARQARQLLGALWPNAATDGLEVTLAGGWGLDVAPGVAAVPAPDGTGSLLCTLTKHVALTLDGPPSEDETQRNDLVALRIRAPEFGGELDSGGDFVVELLEGPTGRRLRLAQLPPAAIALARVQLFDGDGALVPEGLVDMRPGGLRCHCKEVLG